MTDEIKMHTDIYQRFLEKEKTFCFDKAVGTLKDIIDIYFKNFRR